MSSKVELLTDEPIVMQTLSADFNYRADMPADIEQLRRILDQQSQPVFFIVDVLEMSMSLDDIFAAASMASGFDAKRRLKQERKSSTAQRHRDSTTLVVY